VGMLKEREKSRIKTTCPARNNGRHLLRKETQKIIMKSRNEEGDFCLSYVDIEISVPINIEPRIQESFN
jgi:hypothetical protein